MKTGRGSSGRRWPTPSPASTRRFGVLGALLERASTGRGKLVEVSMLEAMAHFAVEPFAAFFALGVVPKSSDRPRLAQAYILRTADAKLIAIHLSSLEKFWLGLVKALDADELARDDAFQRAPGAHRQLRGAGRGARQPLPRAARSRSGAQRLNDNDVPFAPINGIDAVVEDPQVGHLGLIVPVNDAQQGGRAAVRPALQFDGERARSVSAAPLLDQHGAAIRAAVNDSRHWPAAIGRRGSAPGNGLDEGAMSDSNRKLFPTTLVGSLPQPEWLIDRKKLAGRFPPRVRALELWRVGEDFLDEAQNDATVLAIRAQEEAGLDIVTDGEIRRESYSNRFATALEGVDLDNPGTAIDRSGHPNPGAARRRHHSPQARGAGGRPEIPARAYQQAGEGHGAGPVHDGAAGADRRLRRQPRSGRDGLRARP